MSDLAERFKGYLRERHAGAAPLEETLLLLDVYDVLMDIRRNSLTGQVPQKFRQPYVWAGKQRVPKQLVSFENALHKLLSVCVNRPLRIKQLHDRHESRWGTTISVASMNTGLYRLRKHGYVERPNVGEYCLTDLGRRRLRQLRAPPMPSRGGPGAVLIRSLLEETYQPTSGEYLATYSAEALERALELLETA